MIVTESRRADESRRFEKFFDDIKDLFKKRVEEKGIKEEIKISPVELKGYTIDLPKKEKALYHSSSFEILCNVEKTWCKVQGDLVVETKREEDVSRELENTGDCMIFDTHRHIGRREDPRPESHIHFICKDTEKEDTIKIIKFLKDQY